MSFNLQGLLELLQEGLYDKDWPRGRRGQRSSQACNLGPTIKTLHCRLWYRPALLWSPEEKFLHVSLTQPYTLLGTWNLIKCLHRTKSTGVGAAKFGGWVVRSLVDLSRARLQLCPAFQDLPSFTQNVHRLVNDLRYYRLCNDSLPPGTVKL